MMEIDLPRMQSLSPHFDSPTPMDSMPGMTQLDLTDVSSLTDITLTDVSPSTEPELEPDPSCYSVDNMKNCDWKLDTGICGCKYINKSGCGCKYINKVGASGFDDVRLSKFIIIMITKFIKIAMNPSQNFVLIPYSIR